MARFFADLSSIVIGRVMLTPARIFSFVFVGFVAITGPVSGCAWARRESRL